MSADSTVDRTLAAQTLLAAIAERGADAAGYTYREPGGQIVLHKQRSGASALLDRIAIPQATTQLLVHVRDYTKGHPTIDANNHPVRHGHVVGVHNGTIVNDDEVLAAHGIERAHPRMTVDSEVIFALAAAFDSTPRTLEQLRGSMAAAWLDERRPDVLFLARGVGRPLWLGTARGDTFFASTKAALVLVERYLRRRLAKREVAEGTLIALESGREVERQRFRPDRSVREEELPAVRAPAEGSLCLSRLAAIASTT